MDDRFPLPKPHDEALVLVEVWFGLYTPGAGLN
jgi:hypothetical protein